MGPRQPRVGVGGGRPRCGGGVLRMAGVREMNRMTETERLQRHEQVMRDLTLQQMRSVEDWVQTMRVLGESKEKIFERLSVLEMSVQRTKERYA